LRRVLRAARRDFVAALGEAGRIAAEAALAARLRRRLPRPGVLAGYVAHRGEPDILPVLVAAFHEGRTVALPHIADDVGETGAMGFTLWSPDALLRAGHAGIPQPARHDPVTPDILLIPLVGFDRAGRRLGQGGGFYDRWIAAHPATRRIGIAWSAQESGAIPADPWDMPLDAIATEREWIEP
jgi:5-formyltetrahydrofolate cyclo-ligase